MSSSKARFFNPAVVGLIMLSFFLGTSEYTVIGILPEIADGFCSAVPPGTFRRKSCGGCP